MTIRPRSSSVLLMAMWYIARTLGRTTIDRSRRMLCLFLCPPAQIRQPRYDLGITVKIIISCSDIKNYIS